MFPSTVTKFAAAAGRGLRLVEDWLEISRQRRHLAALDDRMLKDIGLSRATAEKEANRRFWDLPERYGRVSGRHADGRARARSQRGSRTQATPASCGICGACGTCGA